MTADERGRDGLKRWAAGIALSGVVSLALPALAQAGLTDPMPTSRSARVASAARRPTARAAGQTRRAVRAENRKIPRPAATLSRAPVSDAAGKATPASGDPTNKPLRYPGRRRSALPSPAEPTVILDEQCHSAIAPKDTCPGESDLREAWHPDATEPPAAARRHLVDPRDRAQQPTRTVPQDSCRR
jgi:hypothetical protein